MLPFLSLLASVCSPGLKEGRGQTTLPALHGICEFLWEKNGRRYQCGGFLVQDNFVLTAAHCNGRNMTVTLGAHNIRKRENTQQDIPVLRAFPHQAYNAKKHINDIMLLKLENKAQLNRNVQTIPLPCHQDMVELGKVCSAAGWGKMADGELSNTLQEVDLQVQVEKKCKKNFQPKFNNSTQLCVGNPKSKKATGHGDSGGPLVCKGVAQGIVSYAYKWPPRVFTRISSFVPWIHRTMKLTA